LIPILRPLTGEKEPSVSGMVVALKCSGREIEAP
jgi:hypothetical protein